MKNQKIFSTILIAVGLIILLANAADYLGGFFGLSWEYHIPSSTIGIMFFIIGIAHRRSLEKSEQKPNKKRK